MKITLYELLGLIKDGKAPKKIAYNSVILEYDEENEDYYSYYSRGLFEYKFTTCNDFLNDEVEILDEERKPITKESIEALGYACGEIRKCFENGWNKSLENKPLIEEDKKIEKCKNYENFLEIDDYIEHLKNKIDELINEINKLKEK